MIGISVYCGLVGFCDSMINFWVWCEAGLFVFFSLSLLCSDELLWNLQVITKESLLVAQVN